MIVLNTWRPQMRHITYTERPDYVPEWVYAQAQAAKYAYNANWDFWVWDVSKQYNVSQAIAEDACIRGIKKEILRQYLVYGPKIGKWFEEFLDMGDIFTKVKHPTYLPKLDDLVEKK